ncbi:MAG TPA: NADH-quinone oxidoreductase subunit L [Clostridia bacterium]|nr:NADH-quinone oxidoreductase subunit L [Clostridia bacterium]
MFFLEHIWIIPLLPAFGAAAMFFFGKRLSKPAVNAICVGMVALAFLLSCMAVYQYVHTYAGPEGKPFEKVMYTWLGSDTGKFTFPMRDGQLGQFKAEAGFLLDPLSCIWLLFVTGIGMLIHIYSTGYMAHEGGYYRFFGYLNLFMFSMLTLILGNNYMMMFVGWEGVGLCSYLLIGFYFHKHSASTAANKAFIVNRVGDAGVLLGSMTIMWYLGTVKFTAINETLRSGNFQTGDLVLTAATLLLFLGACGKSAQLPLYVWLPDAMEGPTPVSALIHAATMVTAGVYMVARSNALFQLAPTSMEVVAVVGGLTAIFAASIGLVQNDIKRVLAYSTVSQLGYMFLALGVGAFAAGVFHVFTHAFFKALLFLGSGSVIHAMSGEQDMRFMGGLSKKIPVTFRTMLIGTLAIAGIPGLAGFFSKDEILWQTWSSNNGQFRILWVVAFITALMTAFYMFRLIWLTFFSKPRMSHEVEHHIHESPKSMTIPLMVLALGSIFVGYLGVPASLGGSNHFEKFLEPVFAREAHGATTTHSALGAGEHGTLVAGENSAKQTEGEQAATEATHVNEAAKEGIEPPSNVVPAHAAHEFEPLEYILMVASVAAALLGMFLAYRAYRNADKGYTEPINEAAPAVYRTLFNKYYVDELYDILFTGRRKLGTVRLGVQGLGIALWKFDANVIDGGVNGAGWMTKFFGWVLNWWDKWIIDGLLVNGPAVVARVLSYPVRLVQWGLVQWYALVMVCGLVGFIWYYVIR